MLTAVEMVERDILQGPVIESREEESSWDPSTVFSIVITLVVAACALGGFTACVCKCLKHQRDLEEYDRVKAKLKRIERERTRLASIDLAGTYNALLSCPICLEVRACVHCLGCGTINSALTGVLTKPSFIS